MPSTSTTFRIPVANLLRQPGASRPVQVEGALADLRASRRRDRVGLADRGRPACSSGCPRASSCGARSTPAGTRRAAAASSRSAATLVGARRTSCTRRHPLEGETYLLDERRHRPRAAGARRAAARAARWRPLCRPDCRGPVPDLRRRPQPDALRLRHQRARPPLGGACGRSSSDLSTLDEELRDGRPEAQDEPLGDPLAQVGEHAARAAARTRCARTAARRGSPTRCAATAAGTEAARSSTSSSGRTTRCRP